MSTQSGRAFVSALSSVTGGPRPAAAAGTTHAVLRSLDATGPQVAHATGAHLTNPARVAAMKPRDVTLVMGPNSATIRVRLDPREDDWLANAKRAIATAADMEGASVGATKLTDEETGLPLESLSPEQWARVQRVRVTYDQPGRDMLFLSRVGARAQAHSAPLGRALASTQERDDDLRAFVGRLDATGATTPEQVETQLRRHAVARLRARTLRDDVTTQNRAVDQFLRSQSNARYTPGPAHDPLRPTTTGDHVRTAAHMISRHLEQGKARGEHPVRSVARAMRASRHVGSSLPMLDRVEDLGLSRRHSQVLAKMAEATPGVGGMPMNGKVAVMDPGAGASAAVVYRTHHVPESAAGFAGGYLALRHPNGQHSLVLDPKTGGRVRDPNERAVAVALEAAAGMRAEDGAVVSGGQAKLTGARCDRTSLPLVELSGEWRHVAGSPKHVPGWVPAGQKKGGASGFGIDPKVAKACERHHDGECELHVPAEMGMRAGREMKLRMGGRIQPGVYTPETVSPGANHMHYDALRQKNPGVFGRRLYVQSSSGKKLGSISLPGIYHKEKYRHPQAFYGGHFHAAGELDPASGLPIVEAGKPEHWKRLGPNSKP